MSVTTLLLLVLVVLAISTMPTWRYSRSWGWGPFGLLTVLLGVLLVVMLLDLA